MSAKHSKEVTDRIRSGDHLLSAFDVEGPRVAACFLDETRPHIEEGDDEPNPGVFLVAAGRMWMAVRKCTYLVSSASSCRTWSRQLRFPRVVPCSSVGAANGSAAPSSRVLSHAAIELVFCLLEG